MALYHETHVMENLMAFIVIPAENLRDGVFAITTHDSIPVLQSENPQTMELRAECKFSWIKMLHYPRDNGEISIMRQTNVLESQLPLQCLLQRFLCSAEF